MGWLVSAFNKTLRKPVYGGSSSDMPIITAGWVLFNLTKQR